MKKRLLALCLAAALLLGMMPALSLPASAETVTDTTKVAVAYPVTDTNFVYGTKNTYGYPIGAGNNSYALNWLDSCFRLRASAGGREYVTFGANVDLDHTKQVAVSHILTVDGGNFAPTDAYGESIALNEGELAYNGILYTLKDSAANGGVVYAVLHKNSGSQLTLSFLVPDGNGSFTLEYVRLGMVPTRNTINLIWNLDGTVTVQIDGTTKATTQSNVTWTHAQVTAAGMPVAEEGFRGTLHCEDYTNTSVHPYALSQVSLWQCTANCTCADGEHAGITISHTYEVAEPAALDSYFTAETLNADNALTEESWKHADYETVGGYDTAVLVNKGTAYVALKSDTVADDTAVTVKLGEAEKSATFANGVAEVAFANAVSGYGAETELTVGAEVAELTFAAKAVSAQPVAGATETTNVYFNNPSSDPNLQVTAPRNDPYAAGEYFTYRLRSNASQDAVFAATVDLDHTKQVKVTNSIGMDPSHFGIDSNGTVSLSNRVLSYNGILYTLKDGGENGGVVYALFYRHANQRVGIKFIIPDGNGGITTTDLINFGVITSTSPWYNTTLIWNVDGTVTVQLSTNADNAVRWTTTTTQNVTWTNEQAAIMPEAREGFSGTAHFGNYSFSSASISQFYVYPCDGGIPVTQTEFNYIVDIETTLADDLWDAIDAQIDPDNLVYLPAVIEHPYLGNVALEWFCDPAELVSDGVVITPDEDVDDAYIWAEVDGELVYEAGVVVKAAEPVYGFFTTNVSTAWHLVPFTKIAGTNDSVAVLAKDKDTVYVAVKSASASATVTLGTEEQTVEIIDGIGYATFENVGLSQFGDAREFVVVTENGTLENKVVLDNQINLESIGGTTTNVNIDYPLTDSNFVHVGSLGPDSNSYAFKWLGASNPGYQMRSTVGGREFVTFGTSLDLDHTRTVAVSHFLGLDFNNFGIADGTVTLSNGALAYNGILYTLKDSAASGGVVYALFYRHSNDRVGIKFIVPDGEGGIATTDLINFGFFPKGGTDRYETKFVWNVDGTVTVLVTDAATNALLTNATTAENVTWTHAQAAIMPAAEEGFRGTLHFEDYSFSQYSLAQAYIYSYNNVGFAVNYPDAVADIQIPDITGWSIDLGSDIGLNFYMDMAARTGAVINVSLAGEPFKTINAWTMKPVAAGTYMAEANIAAVQMTEEIKVELSVFGFAIDAETMTSSVKDYVAEIKKPEYAMSDAEVALADAMLVYGAAAQKYFKYNTEALASDVPPSEALLDVTGDYTLVANGELAGVTAKSATLLLQERVIIRYYFELDSVDGLKFDLNGQKLTPAYSTAKGYWYVEVDVLPQDMAEIYTVTVSPVEGEGSVSLSYSCLHYMVNKADSTVKNLPALMEAMYDYYVAADIVAGAK